VRVKLQPVVRVLAGLMLVSTIAAVVLPNGFGRLAYGDTVPLFLGIAACVAFFQNAVRYPKARAFWILFGIGLLMWTSNQFWWTYFEVFRRVDFPEPFIGDIILFAHVVPCMAAVVLRPHVAQRDRRISLDTINFLMLLLWWLFLYAFIVFPDEFVIHNTSIYSPNYNLLYLLEDSVLIFTLGYAAASTRTSWRFVYWNLFAAFSIYTVGSETINTAINSGKYSSGSLYDLPLQISAAWMFATALIARQLPLETVDAPQSRGRFTRLMPRALMAAILSLPLLGLWAIFFDHESARLRDFRILVTLIAALVLGLFVFLKQFLLDRKLIGLLDESRSSYQSLRRLQSQLVQKEKLASLGQLVAGAAHEINNPLTAILGYSEMLTATPGLSQSQTSMVEKIGQQARRTRDLVADLLSFAQQSPSDKGPVDIGALLNRALQMQEVPTRGKNIRVECSVQPGMARVHGNANQLLQTFLHIVDNAIDALEEVGGGALNVSATEEQNSIVVVFSDSGPGIKEPQRVFDPFYTTKPVGKGTGLGLSATYGVIQDHHGQISCHNKPEGGAVFTLRLPAAPSAAAAQA
jgi:signal transduction histidine kinase